MISELDQSKEYEDDRREKLVTRFTGKILKIITGEPWADGSNTISPEGLDRDEAA